MQKLNTVNQKRCIGVFDTGAGGRLVASRLKKLLPNCDFLVVDDAANAPYGNRSESEIICLVDAAIQPLLDCKYIIIACNTATVAAIKSLRQKYPNHIFIGFEPMIKPAVAVSKNKHIILLATDSTKRSLRLSELIGLYAPDFQIDTPNTRDWAKKIDANMANEISFDEVAASVAGGSDVIIIGCTHYLALVEHLRARFEDVAILEPAKAVAKYLEKIIDK